MVTMDGNDIGNKPFLTWSQDGVGGNDEIRTPIITAATPELAQNLIAYLHGRKRAQCLSITASRE